MSYFSYVFVIRTFVWRPSANVFSVVVWMQTIRSAACFLIGVVALARAFDIPRVV
jgi:hypothetical protein